MAGTSFIFPSWIKGETRISRVNEFYVRRRVQSHNRHEGRLIIQSKFQGTFWKWEFILTRVDGCPLYLSPQLDRSIQRNSVHYHTPTNKRRWAFSASLLQVRHNMNWTKQGRNSQTALNSYIVAQSSLVWKRCYSSFGNLKAKVEVWSRKWSENCNYGIHKTFIAAKHGEHKSIICERQIKREIQQGGPGNGDLNANAVYCGPETVGRGLNIKPVGIMWMALWAAPGHAIEVWKLSAKGSYWYRSRWDAIIAASGQRRLATR